MGVVIKEALGLAAPVRAVYDRLVLGESEKEVAARLGLSAHTVHGHVKKIYKVVGVSSKSQLLALKTTRMAKRLDELETRLAGVHAGVEAVERTSDGTFVL